MPCDVPAGSGQNSPTEIGREWSNKGPELIVYLSIGTPSQLQSQRLAAGPVSGIGQDTAIGSCCESYVGEGTRKSFPLREPIPVGL